MQRFFVLMMTVSLFQQLESNGYYDLIEEYGCHDTEFRLSCDSLTESIVIFDAVFSQRKSYAKYIRVPCGVSNRTTNKYGCQACNSKKIENQLIKNENQTASLMKELKFRHMINRRCSGVKYCSFVFNEDFEEAKEFSPGVVYIRYACAQDAKMRGTCNRDINVTQEGFARTPGYPSYYVGETTCIWKLQAPSRQKVKVTFLDFSVRSVAPHEEDCIDRVVVSENGLILLSTCGDAIEDVVIYSSGSSLNVTFVTLSKTIFPKRGLLFHYKAVGCPSLRKPEDGYLYEKNESFAHFKCCVGFVFPDTLSRDKIVQCHNENTWDEKILDCISVAKLKEEGIYVTLNETDEKSIAAEARADMETSDFLKDNILPIIVMVVLFIGNGIIIFVLHHWKKSLKECNEKTDLMPMLHQKTTESAGE